jgi:hypothetical protein
VSRAVSVRDIDFSMLGPDSPLRQLVQRAPRRDLEHQEQVRVFEWARDHEIEFPDLEWLFAVPNFSGRLGEKTARQGARLKAEGRKPGVLDMWLPVKRSEHPGLVIELKVGSNVPTSDQRRWIRHLLQQGWRVVVAYGADETITVLKEYLR